MDAVGQVLLGWLAFGGTHTPLSHPPLRERLVARLGDRGFLVVYSLVAFATFVPLVRVYFASRVSAAVPLPVLATVPGVWWLTMAMMFVAVNLVVIGFSQPNPVSALTAGMGGAGSGKELGGEVPGGAGGAALARFFAETSFLPFVTIAQGRNRLVASELRPAILAAAAALFGLIFFTHHRIFG